MENSLHALLYTAASQYPDATALAYGNVAVTYKLLDERSSRIARMLQDFGVGRGKRAAVYVDKSVLSIEAIFGVLKSGAGYVPLDPTGPVARQYNIMKDADIDCLLAGGAKFSGLCNDPGFKQGLPAHTMILDKKRSEFPAINAGTDIVFSDDIDAAGPPVVTPGFTDTDTAYILYTSGSTGKPKGVVISHRASRAFVDWSCGVFQLSRRDRISSIAPYHFDLSVFDIFSSIKSAATVCILSQGAGRFPVSVCDFIENQKVSVLYAVPSMLTQAVLNGNLNGRDLSALRLILFAGESFPAKYLTRLMDLVPHAEYYNLYGPTETNVCTYHKVDHRPGDNESIPIGRPCAGASIMLLDNGRHPVDQGTTGEIFVSGPALMDGYFKDGNRTAEVFCELPGSGTDKERFYRTGDLASVNNRGEFEFHGRLDLMVKVRGYRVELQEVESVLLSHPSVAEASCAVVTDDTGANFIKAYIVTGRNEALDTASFRSFLARSIPQYMIPEEFVQVDALPKTSTGKVDRMCLKRSGT